MTDISRIGPARSRPGTPGARARTAWLRWRMPVAALAAAWYAAQSDYGTLLLALVMIYALAVAGWNLISGYGGQPSLGHAAFFGLGAYGAAYFFVELETSPWIGIALGSLLAALLAMLVGWVSWRLKIQGIYFALILFAVAELLLIVVSNIDALGGTTGLYGFVRQDSLWLLAFRNPLWFAGIAAIFLALTLWGTHRMSRSGFGRRLAVIRHDEVAAEAAGIDAMRTKMLVLGVSAFVTAVAGGLYAQLQLFINPHSVFGMDLNLRLILIGFLGGVGTLWGPLIGAVLVTSIETLALETFRGQPGVDGIAFGLMLVVAVSFLPRGLAWRRASAPRIPPASDATAPEAAAPPDEPAVGFGQTILEAEGLTKRFGGLTVVEDVNLALTAGRIHGLIGPNGAGKSTVINMLTGTIRADAGEVRLLGEPLLGRAPYAFARAGVARTFQIPRDLGDLSVWDSVRTAAAASGRAADPDAAARSALTSVGMFDAAERSWGGLNGSERRRVEVARALAQQPRILLLDEPMSGLGAEEIDDLADTIRRLSRDNPEMTILFVEHLMRVMMKLADHITVLDRGRVIARGTPSEITGDAAVRSAYLGSTAT